MPKRLRSDTGDFNAEQARENIETYARKIDLTNTKLHLFSKATGKPKIAAISRALGFDGAEVQTIRKFFSDEPQVFNDDTFEAIAKNTGIHKDYWLGLTTETDQSAYEERLEAEKKFDELERIQRKNREKEIEQYKQFFGMLGYQYEGAGIEEEYTKPTHGIAESSTPEPMQGLSDADMSSLINELSDALGYWLYKRKRETH